MATAVATWPSDKDNDVMQWVAAHAVRIGPSTIPGAGNGVFATIDIPAKRVLGRYHGKLLSKAEFDTQYGDKQATYVLLIGKDKYVDAQDPQHRNWTAIINDSRGTGQRPNCAFTSVGSIKTVRRIAAGDELFIQYGKAYWSA